MSERAKKDADVETRVLPWLPGYSVARNGTIFSELGDEPYALTPKSRPSGDLRVRVSIDGRPYDVYVALAVLEAWISPRPEGHVIGYRDADRGNCTADNLTWIAPPNRYDRAKFVRLWQASPTLREVAERMGMTPQVACALASNMRHHGVPLKRFREAIDWESLITLAKDLTDCEE